MTWRKGVSGNPSGKPLVNPKPSSIARKARQKPLTEEQKREAARG